MVELGLLELIDCGVHKMFRIEHNVETGEIKQIELSPEEIAELEIQYAEAKAKSDAEETALAEAKAAEEKKFNDAVAAAVAAALAAQQTPATTSEPVVEPTPEPVVEPVVEEPVVTQE
jgi:hypothetical protein